MDYEVVYDEAYIKPGFIIYNKNNTQFLKIIPNVNDKTPSFTLFISDDKVDNPQLEFRPIKFEIKTNEFLKQLFRPFIGQIMYTIHTSLEGYNQLRIEEENDSISLTFIKDLTFSKNLNYNAMSLTLSSQTFYNVYQKLMTSKEVNYKDSKKVLEKMINLKAA